MDLYLVQAVASEEWAVIRWESNTDLFQFGFQYCFEIKNCAKLNKVFMCP